MVLSWHTSLYQLDVLLAISLSQAYILCAMSHYSEEFPFAKFESLSQAYILHAMSHYSEEFACKIGVQKNYELVYANKIQNSYFLKAIIFTLLNTHNNIYL